MPLPVPTNQRKGHKTQSLILGEVGGIFCEIIVKTQVIPTPPPPRVCLHVRRPQHRKVVKYDYILHVSHPCASTSSINKFPFSNILLLFFVSANKVELLIFFIPERKFRSLFRTLNEILPGDRAGRGSSMENHHSPYSGGSWSSRGKRCQTQKVDFMVNFSQKLHENQCRI